MSLFKVCPLIFLNSIFYSQIEKFVDDFMFEFVDVYFCEDNKYALGLNVGATRTLICVNASNLRSVRREQTRSLSSHSIGIILKFRRGAAHSGGLSNYGLRLLARKATIASARTEDRLTARKEWRRRRKDSPRSSRRDDAGARRPLPALPGDTSPKKEMVSRSCTSALAGLCLLYTSPSPRDS